jgi:hypothetical protein
MASNTIEVKVPDYLSIEQYKAMNDYKGDSNFGRLVHIVSVTTGHPVSSIRKWPLDTLTKIANDFAAIADHHQEFHSIIEWNGELLGYSPIHASSLGEYIDLENLAKDFENNMHKIAAILYRPIKVHRFKSLEFAIKQKIKMVKNKVENVFDWYTVEDYDNEKRKLREETFRDFPAHIFLGAISFFFSSANLYSTNTLYLEGQISRRMKEEMIRDQLEILSHSIGVGGGLYTTSLSPIYFKLQGTDPSQKLTS